MPPINRKFVAVNQDQALKFQNTQYPATEAQRTAALSQVIAQSFNTSQAVDMNTLALADKETVLSVGSKEDADKLWATLQGKDTPVPGTVIESNANQVKVAVTQDSKDAKTADFIVNMKEPIPEKEIPAVGSELKLLKDGGPELDGTYDTYTQVPASATAAASAQIVLKDGILQSKKAPVHKPAAAHHTTTTHKPQQ